MKRVIVKSVFDAFEYVMNHFYPNGQEEMAVLTDTYAVISIQDTHTDGFGFQFHQSKYCKDVLTLYFDDTIKKVDGAVLFSDEQADQIIDFILKNKSIDTLLIHCYGGQSRSGAVGAFAVDMLGENNSRYFETGCPNEYVYKVLESAWVHYQLLNM